MSDRENWCFLLVATMGAMLGIVAASWAHPPWAYGGAFVLNAAAYFRIGVIDDRNRIREWQRMGESR